MIKINYSCFLNRSGYSQAAQDYIYALAGSGKYDLSLNIMNGTPDSLILSQDRLRDMMLLTQKQTKCDYQILHCIPEMQRRVRRLGKTIGFATFETFQPPEVWIPMLNNNDAVICPSLFNVQIFKEAGITKPIFHIPHCIDTNVYNPSVEPQEKRDRFTFLFFGTWRKRKGWPQLIEAFLKEFDINDNVQLVLKTNKIVGSQHDISTLKESLGLLKKETAPIIYESRILDEKELPRFIKSVDCLVSSHYGEGFGLPGLQSMALEVPIIITNFSGCCDYAKPETATLIEPNGFILLNDLDQINQFRNKKWANVTVDSVMKAMRYVVSNYSIVKEKAKVASTFIATNFNYKITANRFDQMLESMHEF